MAGPLKSYPLYLGDPLKEGLVDEVLRDVVASIQNECGDANLVELVND